MPSSTAHTHFGSRGSTGSTGSSRSAGESLRHSPRRHIWIGTSGPAATDQSSAIPQNSASTSPRANCSDDVYFTVDQAGSAVGRQRHRAHEHLRRLSQTTRLARRRPSSSASVWARARRPPWSPASTELCSTSSSRGLQVVSDSPRHQRRQDHAPEAPTTTRSQLWSNAHVLDTCDRGRRANSSSRLPSQPGS